MTTQQIFSFSDEADIFYQGYIFFYSLFKSGQVFIHFAYDTLLSSDIYLKVKNKEYKVNKISFEKLEKFFYSLSIYRQQTLKYLIDDKDSRMSHIAFAIFFYLCQFNEDNIKMRVFSKPKVGSRETMKIEINKVPVKIRFVDRKIDLKMWLNF